MPLEESHSGHLLMSLHPPAKEEFFIDDGPVLESAEVQVFATDIFQECLEGGESHPGEPLQEIGEELMDESWLEQEAEPANWEHAETCQGCRVVQKSFQSVDAKCHQCLQITTGPPPDWVPQENTSPAIIEED